MLLREIEERIVREEDFSFETTLVGRGYLRLIELIYLALPSVEMSSMRVAERVAHGGHNISARDIARRFPRSLLNDYSQKANRTCCFMNSGESPKLIFEQQGQHRIISHEKEYQLLLKEATL